MKGWLKASLIIFIIGIILIIIGFMLGGGSMFFHWNEELESFSQEYDGGIENLKLDIGAAQVVIKEAEGFKVEAQKINKENFKVQLENGELQVINKKFAFNFVGVGNNSSTITIYVPKGFEFNAIKMNLGAGKLEAGTLIAQTTDIEVGAGQLGIRDLTTKDISIDCGVGETRIGGRIQQNAKIHGGVGSITLDLKGKEEEYNYKLQVGVGEVSINGSSYSGLGNDKRITNTQESRLFDIDCGVGKIDISMKE